MHPNTTKQKQNMTLGSNGVDRVHSLWQIQTRLCGTNFCINVLHRVSCSDEMVPNAPKHYKMHENLNFGSNGADKLRLLRKIRMWHKVLHSRSALVVSQKTPCSFIDSTRTPWQCKSICRSAHIFTQTPLSFPRIEPAVLTWRFCELDPRVLV